MAELPLEHTERMFDPGTKTCLVAFECALRVTHAAFHLFDLARLLRDKPLHTRAWYSSRLSTLW